MEQSCFISNQSFPLLPILDALQRYRPQTLKAQKLPTQPRNPESSQGRREKPNAQQQPRRSHLKSTRPIQADISLRKNGMLYHLFVPWGHAAAQQRWSVARRESGNNWNTGKTGGSTAAAKLADIFLIGVTPSLTSALAANFISLSPGALAIKALTVDTNNLPALGNSC
jgi:hypothetical protein